MLKVDLISHLDLTPIEIKTLKETISVEIRKYTDLIKPRMSSAANKVAEEMGIMLSSLTWHKQNSVDPGRKIFHLEHLWPVCILRNACLKASTHSDINDILQKATVVWILKSEDKVLNENGYRSKRKDPLLAYKTCSINII
jgi:hypothetical protein